MRHFLSCAEAEAWLENLLPVSLSSPQNLEDGFCTAVFRTLIERQVPFIVYAGDAQSAEDPDSPFHSGAWLLKPTQPEELIALVRKSFAR